MTPRRSAKNPAALPVRDGFIAGAGARIYYKTLGRGVPVLLLHGGPGADHTDFLPALKPLARRCQLVLIDERGSGRSERLVDPKRYTLDWMVKDIERVRRHFGFARLVVLGHSFGGILAQAYAVRHPQQILGLVLAGTSSSAGCVDRDFRRIRRRLPGPLRTRLAHHEKAGIFQGDGAYTKGYAAASARALAPHMYAKTPPPRFEHAPPLGMEVLREMWVRRSDFRIDGNLKGFDFTHSLARVKAPALVVIGDRDMVSTESAEVTRGSLPRATLVVMAECAHMMYIDQTAAFNRLLEAFLDSCTARRRGRAS
ncbi:MAG TPA: alpha/beta fold hydrolase [Steroidobacteraceae bacterium]|nr:alpha/beta fold hydrolase [Steroidobacteraceae bacterium]